MYKNLHILGTQFLLHLIETETKNHRKCMKGCYKKDNSDIIQWTHNPRMTWGLNQKKKRTNTGFMLK